MTSFKQQYDEAIQQLTQAGSPYETGIASLNGVDYTAFVKAPPTLLDMYAAAQEFGDQEFIIYEGERWTYNDLFQHAASLGHQLVNELGLKKGDRVALAMRNYPEWMTAYIAITSVGGVAVLLNSWGVGPELEFALENSGSRFLFCDQARHDLVAPYFDKLDLRAIVARPTNDALSDRAVSMAAFIAGHENAEMPEVALNGDDYAMMMYTSGTTGKPKGAPSTHRSVMQAIIIFECAAAAQAMINPQAIGAMMEKGFSPTQMLTVPLFHVSGLYAVFLGALKGGRKIVMMYKWDPVRAMQYVQEERVTVLTAAPAMVLEFLEHPELEKYDISSLAGVGGGGSATTPHTAKLMCERIDNSYPGTGWGMTESNAVGASLSGEPFRQKPKSSGFVHPTVEIRVCNEAGEDQPPGEPGDLWLKSMALIQEYWKRPDANAKDFKDGWFNSGDVGYFDEEGFLFLSDRAKDMVIRGGENIYPAEIEAAITDHEAVLEVGAFGLPDEKMGEQLAVAVVPRPGTSLNDDEIRQFAAERLARFKVPHYVWLRENPLPRNVTGKILKKDLRAHYEKLV